MTQQNSDPTTESAIVGLFEKLAGQLGELASSEQQRQAELKRAAANVKEADQREALKEAIAQHATLAKQAAGLAKTLRSTEANVLSDLATLSAVTARTP